MIDKAGAKDTRSRTFATPDNPPYKKNLINDMNDVEVGQWSESANGRKQLACKKEISPLPIQNK